MPIENYQDIVETPCLMRVFKDGGDVLAIFPTIDEGRGTVRCYQHIGQHGSCDRSVMKITRPAKPEEAAALIKELQAYPYGYRLRLIARWR